MMKMIHGMSWFLASNLLLGLAATAADFDAERLNNWHHWRGPYANGVAPNANPPMTWDAETNIKWKTEIPGSGSSTPIVWGDKLFLTTAIDTKMKPQQSGEDTPELKADNGPPQPPNRSGRTGRRRGGFGASKPETIFQFIVICLDRKSGDVVWKQIATEAVPHEGHHRDHGYASGSCTTDGESLFVTFGSRGIYRYDFEGNKIWGRDLGDLNIVATFGEGSTPVLSGDNLIMNWDHEGDSFIVCLDKATGEDKWRVDRDERTTWNTPLVVEHKGVTQVVVNGSNRTRSYDLANGELIWECGGQAGNPIPSPITENGLVFCMSGFRGYALKAIPLDSKGDITDSDKIAWQRDNMTPYVPSPLVYDGFLYFTRSNSGILSCVRADTGEVMYEGERLSGISNIYSSITYADGRIFITGRDGTTLVIKHGPKLEILATNELDEPVDTSPVFLGNEMFLRGAKHVYCISEK